MINRYDCIGCQACVDICSANAIGFSFDLWGEGKADVDASRCINCGLCDRVCPSKNQKFYPAQESVYALISKKNSNTGSSGGFFYEIANSFIENCGVVFGAAFDEKLKLVHRKVESTEDLTSICKSKYLHSDMTDVYKEIEKMLSSSRKVMFAGTPCQVSAVKNIFEKSIRILWF